MVMEYLIYFLKSVAMAIAVGVVLYIILKLIFMAYIRIYCHYKRK